ncbi:MAG: aminopeptidase N [Salibacteraceae bacterium]|jgi:aminopeptidase N
MKKFLVRFILLAVVVSGCNPTKKSSVYLDGAIELAALEVYGSPEYKGSRTRKVDVIHTNLKVSFNWEQQYLFGEAELILKPYFYPIEEVVLDAKGQEIKMVSLISGTLTTPLEFAYGHDMLTIQLDRNYAKSEQLKIRIEYIAKPEERMINIGKAVESDKGLYFINPLGEDPDMSQQIWTQGETEANSVWFPTIDSPNERSTHQIAITVEDKFTTLSNGDLVSSKADGNGKRTDTWVQNKPIAPYLFMMAISDYAVVKDSLDGMQVNYYVDRDYEPYAREIFENTTEMITFYSDLLGYQYPWSKYSQVVVQEYVSGAMENVGAVIFGDYVQQTHIEMIDGKNEDVVAHELFHQWFGDVVTCESWSNLPLNESFATYGEYLWREHKYGRMEADESLHYELSSYLREVNNASAKNAVRFYYNQPDDMFDNHSYAKGGRILHMLRNYVGDEAFFTALKNYLHANEYTAVEMHQLRLAFEEVTGEDLNWFFNQWFMGKGHPELEITYAFDSTNSVQNILVSQVQDVREYSLFKLPVDIDIYANGKRQTYQVVVDSVNQTFSFHVDAKPDLVNFDARKILVCEKTENRTMTEMMFMYENAPLYMDKREAVLFASIDDTQILLAKQLLLNAMMDDYAGIRELAVSKYGIFDEINDLQLRDILITTLQNDQSSAVRTEAIIGLYDKYSWDEGVLPVFENQINTDSSYLVISELIRGIAIADSAKGMIHADQNIDSKSMDVLFSVAEVYSVYGNVRNAPFFQALYPKSAGYEVMSFIDYYKDYLFEIDDVKTQEEGISIFEKEASNKLGWFVRYYAVSAMVDLRDYYETQSLAYAKKTNTKIAADYSGLVSRIDAKLTELRLNEKDQRVFMKR